MSIRRTLWLAVSLVCASAQAVDVSDALRSVHLGVASCAGSTCHGAVKPIGTHPIRQDEYFIWQRNDSHATAYNVLLEARSNAIARRLGWGDAATAEGCLACHADTVAESARGEKWQVADGIGCEVCHGASGGWIESHVDGYKSLGEAQAAGLYPTWDPAARAQMCLSCHQGSPSRPMTHAIMAAGHPPLLFELDTFTTLEPFHHEIDDDYVKRKGPRDSARSWAMGQVMAADALLEALEQGRHRNGLFPELAFFDCDACHHSMKAQREHAARSAGAPVGTVPLADASIVLVGIWARTVDAALAKRWEAAWSGLYRAGYADPQALQRAAGELRALLRGEVMERAGSVSMSPVQVRKVLGGILEAAAGAHAGDYRFAEQTAMASLVLSSALRERGGGTPNTGEKAAVDALYDAVKDRDRFSAAGYAEALGRVRRTFVAQ